ncbi:MAG: hypothetical protein PVH62_03760 [Anaerolineae bacterium]|jgi:hypothetical protein
MDTAIVVLTAGSWIGISILIYFLRKIAGFYERSSGETAYSWLFLFPLVLLPVGALCYVIGNANFVGIPAGDLLLFIGGTSLLFASYLLQQIMMGEQ